ncbi:MAG: ABC transporter permease [Vicinamibacterales bacterium]
MRSLVQDLGYAVRSFRRSPGFTLVALLSLTLGIGATSAIFSVIYGVLIDPYPYARPAEIWAPAARAVDGRGGHTYLPREVAEMAALPAFSDVMATSIETVLLTGEYSPESFGGVLLSGTAFNFLGVAPVIGRTLQPTDVRADGTTEPVVVISHALWLRLFQGSPDALGKTLRLNDRPHTIVGVMPPRFGWYGNDGFWLPLSLTREDLQFVAPIVRLASGVSKQAAEEQLKALHQRLAQEKPQTFPKQGFTTSLTNYLDITVASGEMQASLRLLLGACAFLLLIACANVANLQLARGSARAREMAVRMSIGADRRRLLRQLLTESVLLSLVGGVAGVLFALAATTTIVGLMPTFYVPNESRVAVNIPVMLFSVAVAILTGVISGLVPALQNSKPDLTDALKASRSTSTGSQGGRTRDLLVVAEVALSVVLLVSAGLTVRTFFALQGTDTGIRAERVLIVGVPLPPKKYDTYERRTRFTQDLIARVSRLPGVEAASVGVPFGGPQSSYRIIGQPPVEERRMTMYLVGADHLKTFGITLKGGRMFDAAEVLRGDRVALVTEAAAKLWPAGENPIGARVQLGALERPPANVLVDSAKGSEVTVVGIAADTRNAGFRNAPNPALILPYSVAAPVQRNLAVRTTGDPNLLLNPIRAQVREMDAEQPLGRPITLEEIFGQEVIQPRFTMALFSAFAMLGLTLAAAGIYSVLSFHVTRRTHELGVRMALGASPRSVLALMLSMGGRLVLIGLAVGVPISLASSRLLRSQLFGVQAADPLSYVVVSLLLATVALAACVVPARRAAGVDPMRALRQE